MSDYMFMLESHLSSEQNRVVGEIQAAATASDVRVFLAGGAMRDMLGGAKIRDLDFSVEGNALKMVKAVAEKTGARTVSVDENRRSAELVFPNGETAQIAMARVERYAKTAGKPHVTPATIQEDLRGRDFSINAIALSLNRASRGLLLDPTNGLADLQNHELRALSPYTFYDDPARLFRFIRFRARLGFTVDARTKSQYDNARLAKLESYVSPRTLFEELRNIARETAPYEILHALEEEGLLALISPALAGDKLNPAGFARLEKAARMLPPGNEVRADRIGPFFHALTAKLTPKERNELVRNIDMQKPELDLWQKLEPRARKLETALRSDRLKKPSQVYAMLAKAPGDEVVFLLYHSTQRQVQERIKNYLQKLIPMVQEMPATELSGIALQRGTPKYEKAREGVIAKWLDRRPKKPAPPPVQPPLAMERAPGLRGRGRAS